MKAIFRLFGLPAMLALLVMLPASAHAGNAALRLHDRTPGGLGLLGSPDAKSQRDRILEGTHTSDPLTPPQVSAIYPRRDSADLWDVLTELHLRMYDGVMGVGIADAWPAC